MSLNHINPQHQSKRQREWIYLCHYLAVMGLCPIHIISGSDDGQEPDFTLVFYQNDTLYYIGVELTTLPRLRDKMGDKGLIAKRWYWQSLHLMRYGFAYSQFQQFHPPAEDNRVEIQTNNANNNTNNNTSKHHGFYEQEGTIRIPMRTLYMPNHEFKKRALQLSTITQEDVDAVLAKKGHKANKYRVRRPLHELWLLVHTDKYQDNSILIAPEYDLYHESDFDQIQITRYPSHKVINVKAGVQSTNSHNKTS